MRLSVGVGRVVVPAMVVVVGLVAVANASGHESAAAAPASTTTTTVLVDSPLFVSADYPATASPGDTVRFTINCDRPLGDGNSPSIEVLPEDRSVVPLTEDNYVIALSADLTYAANSGYVDWIIPADQPLGGYLVAMFCDGATDVIQPGVVYPPGIGEREMPFELVAAAGGDEVDVDDDDVLPETK